MNLHANIYQFILTISRIDFNLHLSLRQPERYENRRNSWKSQITVNLS